MTNHAAPDTGKVDPERPRDAGPFDQQQGFSGEDYSPERERAEGRAHPSGEVNPDATRADAPEAHRRDIPPEDGHRAYFDPATGEVHGSGVGAGGGVEGEDYDSDPQNGDGYGLTGVQQQPAETPGSLGPPHFKE